MGLLAIRSFEIWGNSSKTIKEVHLVPNVAEYRKPDGGKIPANWISRPSIKILPLSKIVYPMLYRFRIILDAEEDVFRDVEIMSDNTLEDLHNVILQSFGFDGNEMASFYVSDDDWNQGEEISQFDMTEGGSDIRLMNETTLDDVVSEEQTKLIYVYDFLNMWTFLVELAEVAEPDPAMDYPNLMFVHGQLPAAAPEKEFEAENDDFRDDDLDIDDYDDMSFDVNWN